LRPSRAEDEPCGPVHKSRPCPIDRPRGEKKKKKKKKFKFDTENATWRASLTAVRFPGLAD
jgi:hypothetical protein